MGELLKVRSQEKTRGIEWEEREDPRHLSCKLGWRSQYLFLLVVSQSFCRWVGLFIGSGFGYTSV